jgi:hypothetical protein
MGYLIDWFFPWGNVVTKDMLGRMPSGNPRFTPPPPGPNYLSPELARTIAKTLREHE